MEPSASEHVEVQSHTEMTIKKELEETAQPDRYIEIEVNVNCIKEEPGLVDLMKMESGLSVKEQVAGVGWHDKHHSKVETQPEQKKQSLYKCDKCSKKYKCKKVLIAHDRRVHGSGSHKCTECNIKYKCKDYLATHIRNVHSKQQYECTICKKMCKSREAQRCHVARCYRRKSAGSEPRIYSCDYCQKSFTIKTSIIYHITCLHASGSYKCSQCNKTFKCEQYLSRHTAKVHTTLRAVCNVCGKSLRPSHLRWHMRNMHTDKQLQCKVCGETMKSKQHLHQHVIDLHGQQSAVSSPVVYTCDYCQKKYLRKHTLVVHIESVHGKVRHRCSECKVEVKCKRYLQRHIKMMHSKDDHECEFCKKIFRTKRYYNKHVRSVHCKKTGGTSEESGSHQESTCGKFGQGLGSQRNRQQREGSAKCPHATDGDLNAVASTSTQQHDVVTMKEEPADGELELGPVTFQHMDRNYRQYKEEPLLD